MVIVCALALALFLARPRVGRLRGTVTQAIAQGVDRHVEISSIHLRLFPRPGFELDNLVIQDDPQFGPEPLLRAPDVTAWLRVGALLRGRIEIATLSLSDASLNLTRNSKGKWNLEDLVERASRSTLAPTPNGRTPAHATFPYIEATRARVNFKIGAEKTHFALTNAELALWQDSPDTWGARIKAAPIRTDANLTDTGVIDLNGTWRRSAGARQTPLQLSFQWKQAQIGQLSRLLYGVDKDWRGGVLISGSATGTPEKLRVALDASVEDFRHRGVIGVRDLHLAARCAAELNLPARAMASLDCLSPAGAGFLEFKGSGSGTKSGYVPFSDYDFWLVASKVPTDNVFQLARHATAGFQSDLTATGELEGSLEINRDSTTQKLRLKGNGTAHDLQLASVSSGSVVAVGTLPLTLTSAEKPDRASANLRSQKTRIRATGPIPIDQARLVLGPIDVSMGERLPLQVQANFSFETYAASVSGDSRIERLLQNAHALAIPTPVVSADGDASVDLTVGGTWANARPLVLGTAQLRSVRAKVTGLNSPMDIQSARLIIAQDSTRVQNLLANTAGTSLRGSLLIPRPCPTAADCVVQFNLHAPTLSAAALNQLLNPAFAKTPWYRILAANSSLPPYLLRARATGKLSIDELQLGNATVSDLAADLKLNTGKISLSSIQASALGGSTTGSWTADFSGKVPSFSGEGKLQGVALAKVAQLTHESWIDGTGTASYKFSASGRNWQELLGSADLTAEYELRNGIFPHIVFVGSPEPLHTTEFSGEIRLHDSKFFFQNATLRAQDRLYSVNGTATLGGSLTIKVANEGGGFNISGTLARTKVSAIPTAQAALKP